VDGLAVEQGAEIAVSAHAPALLQTDLLTISIKDGFA